jgi:hypothetical protein
MTYRTKNRKGCKCRKSRKNKTLKRRKGGELLDKSIPPPGYVATTPNNTVYPQQPLPRAIAPMPQNMVYPPQPPPIPVANTQNTGMQPQARGNPSQIVCPDAKKPCNTLDKEYKGKQNPTWDTCINMNGIYNHIIYITQNNVIIKSPETIQIPHFNILMNNKPVSCKIMIIDKYIASFIFICGNWYAMMRLLGTTINVDYFARTEKNEAFYLLNGITIDINTNNPNEGSGVIDIPKYDNVNEDDVSQKLSTSKTPTIRLIDGSFTNINKSSMVNNQAVFNVLQRFRQQKLAANDAKHEVAESAATVFVEGFLYIFGL